MADSEEELKSLLMKVKEESENVGISSTFRLRFYNEQILNTVNLLHI